MGVGGYLAHLTGGVPKSLWPLWFIMIPVEFLGLFTKPFALTVRLPELPGKKELEKHGERWRPYRSVASWYLWRTVEQFRSGLPVVSMCSMRSRIFCPVGRNS